MKLFSLQNFGERIKTVITRFPFVIFFSIACTICLIIFIENVHDIVDPEGKWIFKCLALTALGVPLLFAIQLWSEVNTIKKAYWISHGLGLAFLILLFFTLPKGFHEYYYMANARLVGYFIAFHLLVSFIAYLGQGSVRNFWDFNVATFFSFLESALYSLVLFMGISLAFAAVENLFEVNLHDEIYADTFLVIAGIFHSFYFLSEIKKSLYEEDVSVRDNRIFKFFSKFILLPLTLIYFAILYAFSIKLLVQGEWSEGWISSLILGFSITGIIAYLFNYYQETSKNSLISIFKKWFFPALLPMAIVMFLAVNVRVNDYGVTENRYIGYLTAVWLAGLSVYFIFHKNPSLKFIPISIFAIVLVSILGPGNMSRIGIISQTNRMGDILEDLDLLENGKLETKIGQIGKESSHQISSIINYLDDRGQLDAISKYQSEAVPLVMESDTALSWAQIVDRLGIENYNPNFRNEEMDLLTFNAYSQSTMSIADFDYVQKVEMRINFYNQDQHQFKFDKKNKGKDLILTSAETTITQFALAPVLSKFKELDTATELKTEDLSFSLKNEKAQLLFVCNFLQLDVEDDVLFIEAMDGMVYIKLYN